jgi:hypothetical protein
MNKNVLTGPVNCDKPETAIIIPRLERTGESHDWSIAKSWRIATHPAGTVSHIAKAIRARPSAMNFQNSSINAAVLQHRTCQRPQTGDRCFKNGEKRCSFTDPRKRDLCPV